MKKILKIFPLIFFFLVPQICFGMPPEGIFRGKYPPSVKKEDKKYDFFSRPRTFLISQPGSGNTWVRYALEFLTKRPTLEWLTEDGKLDHDMSNAILPPNEKWHWFMHHPINDQISLGVDYEKPPIFKRHYYSFGAGKELYPLLKSKDILIIIVRDFHRFEKSRKKLRAYFNILKLYDMWDPARRHLIYYEDAVNQPIITFEKLLLFLGESPENLDDFERDLNMHQERSKRIHRDIRRIRTSQKKSSNKQNVPKKSASIDVRKDYPLITQRYLRRYL